jgi:acid phosphatase (class A)
MRTRKALAALLAGCLLAAALAAPVPALGAPDLEAVVGTPPDPKSEAARIDLAIVLWEQERRTPADVARAASEVSLGLSAFADALPPGFEPARFPLTRALLELAQRDAKAVTDALKARFARPRPFTADARVRPAIAREESPSFPSGHATRGVLFAMLLGELAPAHKAALLERGRLVGFDRVVGGVHFPSDVRSGQRLGAALAERLLATPAYEEALRSARAEWPPR